MRGRREGTSHWVLEAPCEAFFNLRQLRKIPINWAMYQMKEFLHIKRCSTCQAYGHTANSKESILWMLWTQTQHQKLQK
ncbi:hypothetical protein AVEN_92904-1 [Araneus ventricosus]|uniref:Uncharacterized protein n=1 Tax=Araneus ventricosus TaxID=182803 RepID=A0A4Y2D271_ARAVE|nr:hypothetical protein AVEN_92904-1 [Araneus ventricosus]